MCLAIKTNDHGSGLASEQWRALLMIEEVLHAPHTVYEGVSG
jgi:hypothetical protein